MKGRLGALLAFASLAGSNLRPQRVDREVRTLDVATTLSAFVGARPPSGASGRVLPEVMHR